MSNPEDIEKIEDRQQESEQWQQEILDRVQDLTTSDSEEQ